MTITAAEARPGDILLDSGGTAWQRGPEAFTWSTFAGPVGFYGPWDEAYGPQGDLTLLVRDGKLAWLAPHVSEHRCGPPESGVTVTPSAPAGSGGTSGTLLPPSTTITVSGSVTSERDLLERLQQQLRRANANWRRPGYAA